jgi:hypothetical protein
VNGTASVPQALKEAIFHEARIMTKQQPSEPSGAPRKEVQPGTGMKGKSWQSRRPDPDDKDAKLEEALEDSFPASDPPQPAQPGVTGWDAEDEIDEKAGKKR